MSGAVTKVTVCFNNLTHSIANDIDALVVAPGGQNLLVMSDGGSTGTFTLRQQCDLELRRRSRKSAATVGSNRHRQLSAHEPEPGCR